MKSSYLYAYPLEFFVLAYAFSWLMWLPGVLASQGVLTTAWQDTPLDILAGFGPSFAAFWLTWQQTGKAGVRQLWRTALHFRFGWWFAFVVLVPPALVTLATMLGIKPQVAESSLWQTPDFLPSPLFLPLYFLYSLIFLGPLGEEFGWRGYALEHLQMHWSGLTASVIVGVFWGVWHLPLFWLSGTAHSESLPLEWFVLSAVFLSILFTYIYNHTGKNLLAVILFHQVINFSLLMSPIATAPSNFVYLTLLYGLAAGGLVIAKGRGLDERGRKRPFANGDGFDK